MTQGNHTRRGKNGFTLEESCGQSAHSKIPHAYEVNIIRLIRVPLYSRSESISGKISRSQSPVDKDRKGNTRRDEKRNTPFSQSEYNPF
jgi:hypothetical protein